MVWANFRIHRRIPDGANRQTHCHCWCCGISPNAIQKSIHCWPVELCPSRVWASLEGQRNLRGEANAVLCSVLVLGISRRTNWDSSKSRLRTRTSQGRADRLQSKSWTSQRDVSRPESHRHKELGGFRFPGHHGTGRWSLFVRFPESICNTSGQSKTHQDEAEFLSRLGPVCPVPDRSIAGATGHDRQRPLHCYDLWYGFDAKDGRGIASQIRKSRFIFCASQWELWYWVKIWGLESTDYSHYIK